MADEQVIDAPETNDAPSGDTLAAGAETETKATETPAPEATPEAGETPAPKPKAEDGDTLAGGGKAVETPVPQDFPDNWAELLANGDKKLQKRLERLGSVKGVAEAWKNADERINSGKVVAIPGENATDEEKAAYFKAIGVPETPEGYTEKVKLADGRVLGDADKPIFESFAKALHPFGASPDVVNAATDWWMDFQQANHEQQAEDDASFRIESEVALKQEFGGDYANRVNAIGQLFTNADPEVRDLLLNGRAADGRKFGDHPGVVKFLSSLALDLNPSGGLTPVDGSTVTAMETELANLRKLMANDTSEYWEGPNAKHNQKRMAELLDMKAKIDARKGA